MLGKKTFWWVLLVGFVGFALWFRSVQKNSIQHVRSISLFPEALVLKELRTQLDQAFVLNTYPKQLQSKGKAVCVEYTFEQVLQEEIEELFRLYRPDYGAFVAIDAETGRILSLVNHVQNQAISVKKEAFGATLEPNLVLQAFFPSASIFKVVTAAAAIETQKLNAETSFSFRGKRSTLYRSQVFQQGPERWLRSLSFKQAFAQSVNPVFARLGLYELGPEILSDYAHRFGFNRALDFDFPVQEGKAWIPTEDAWGLAESASGFTRQNTMSPLQGALIASAVVGKGEVMRPFLISKIREKESQKILYEARPQFAWKSVEAETADNLRVLMQETVTRGTSRRAFRGFLNQKKQIPQKLEVGGKTGSLSGLFPQGKYDWFVGYADNGEKKLALAVMTVHQDQWRVKSAYLARRAIERYYCANRSPTAEKNPPPKPRMKKRQGRASG